MVTDEFAQFYAEQIGNLEERFNGRLAAVGTPLRYRGRVLAQFLG